MNKKALLLGAGSSRDKRIPLSSDIDAEWGGYDLVALDYNADHKPDIVADLEVLPYSWAEDNSYDRIDAYEVLEHTGQMGDWKFFFAQFSELWRILKPGGVLCASVPNWSSLWAFGDPSHKRVINHGTLVFLDQQAYKDQVGQTAMSDFRNIYRADYEQVRDGSFPMYNADSFFFILRAIKPSRWRPR